MIRRFPIFVVAFALVAPLVLTGVGLSGGDTAWARLHHRPRVLATPAVVTPGASDPAGSDAATGMPPDPTAPDVAPPAASSLTQPAQPAPVASDAAPADAAPAEPNAPAPDVGAPEASTGNSMPAEDLGPGPEPTYETGVVKSVAHGPTAADRRVTVELSTGQKAGSQVTVEQHMSGQTGFDLPVAPGDGVVLVVLADPRDPNAQPQYQLADYQRARPVGWMLAGVAVLMLLVGGLRGLKTLGVLLLTGGAVVGVLIPLTLRGWSPLPLAVGLGAAIAVVTTLLTAGLNRKSGAAVVGTIGAVAISTGLATWFAAATRLSGVASEEAAGALALSHGPIDFAGLLAAGMVIGALGVMLDLALSISASVTELADANPGLNPMLLWQAGMQVGRDMLSTSSNTLLLAYLGGFLPVLLSYGAQGLSGARLVHQEGLAAEAATLAIGLIGLLLVVPLTALIATWMQPTLPGGSQRVQSDRDADAEVAR